MKYWGLVDSFNYFGTRFIGFVTQFNGNFIYRMCMLDEKVLFLPREVMDRLDEENERKDFFDRFLIEN